jgi:hypothetical protein
MVKFLLTLVFSATTAFSFIFTFASKTQESLIN